MLAQAEKSRSGPAQAGWVRYMPVSSEAPRRPRGPHELVGQSVSISGPWSSSLDVGIMVTPASQGG